MNAFKIKEKDLGLWQCGDCIANVENGKADLCPRCEAFASQDYVALRESPYSPLYMETLGTQEAFKASRNPSDEELDRFSAVLDAAAISPLQREVLTMRFVDGLSVSGIGERLGSSKTWAFKQMKKGLSGVREGLTNFRLVRGTLFSSPGQDGAPADVDEGLASIYGAPYRKSSQLDSGERRMNFLRCPRCGTRGFERFPIYGVCHDCNYFEAKSNRTVAQQKDSKQRQKAPDPHPFKAEVYQAENQFTNEDHKIVRHALLSIPEREQKVVFLYFWKDQKKQEIAEKLSLSIEQVEKILGSAFGRLRALCERDPRFSRALRRAEVAAA